MSRLPTKPLPEDSIEIAGERVVFKSLSRAAALKLHTFAGAPDEAEVFILCQGTGCTEEEARAFRDGNDTETAGALIDGILILSGLTKTKQPLTTNGPQGARGTTEIDPKDDTSAPSPTGT